MLHMCTDLYLERWRTFIKDRVKLKKIHVHVVRSIFVCVQYSSVYYIHKKIFSDVFYTGACYIRLHFIIVKILYLVFQNFIKRNIIDHEILNCIVKRFVIFISFCMEMVPYRYYIHVFY